MKRITALCLAILMLMSQFSAAAAPGQSTADQSFSVEKEQSRETSQTDNDNADKEEEEPSVDPYEELIRYIDESNQKAEAGSHSQEEELPAQIVLDKNQGLEALRISGRPAESQQEAASALAAETELSEAAARDAAKALFAPLAAPARALDPGVPRQADGSSIEGISAKWITADTIDNGDPALLYVKPAGDETQSLRLQISYALSGEHNYEPGDVTITVPAHIFKDREGRNADKLLIPFLEEPSTKGDFNWKLVGDNYVLTNTRMMSAATKGYIQFAVMDLVPHTIPDSRLSDAFSATIEVVTHLGNVIGLESNALTAVIDTEARVTSTTKRASEAKWVPASEIPASQRIAGETEYVVVDWTVWGYTAANTVYDLKVEDIIPNQYNGFIVNSDSGNSLKKTVNVNDTYRTGMTSTWTFRSAYPASQFQPDTEYIFNNTVTMTVTEEDPAVGGDPRLVTSKTASASRSFSYHAPKWIEPQGHFNVFKNGNDDWMGQYRIHRNGGTYSPDRHIYDNGYYGIYPKALNQLRAGEDIELAYTVDTIGYIFPWTYKYNPADGEMSARIQSNYGQYSVTMTTTDTGMRLHGQRNLQVFTDYEFKAVEFPYLPYIWSAYPHNINPDGSWTALHAGDGTFLYERDNDNTHIPDIKLEIKIGGQWQEYATASYTSGQPVITKKDGTAVSGIRVELPAGVETFRTVVTTNIAAVQYDVRPIVTLKSTAALRAAIESAFERYYTPEMAVYNGTNMVAVSSKNPSSPIVSIDKEGYDAIRGYTSDIMVVPEKQARQNIEEDVDFENRQVTVHYSASVTERSFIADAFSYQEAMEEGVIPAETHGIWRDLLPRGATPLQETVKLREGDAVRNIYTIENYKNTGRTLLVVEADLTPVPTRYKSGDTYYYQDELKISFDAIYSFDSVIDYGEEIHNVISFESGHDSLGTIEGYRGEPDDPNGGRHVGTPGAFEDQEEKDAMTDLNPDHNNPSFVYAGVTTKLDLVTAARTSLNKEVQTNYDGRWSDGIWRGNPEENARVVYTGGIYQYRLRMMSDADTVSKNLLIFDSLENFYAGAGNDAVDIGAPRWQGSLISVDVSQLVLQGCAPVVYYSLVEELELADHEDPNQGNILNMDLSNRDIWIPAAEYTGNMSAVKAVAVDASKREDNSDFVLQPLESAVVIINMQAPSDASVAQLIADGAHAYNNAYLLGTSVDVESGQEDSENFVRKDYTKVGLEEFKIGVKKLWQDDNNRDGIRPQNVTVRLLADGADTGKTLSLTGLETDLLYFTHIPYCRPDGTKIIYSIEEVVPEGYRPSVSISGMNYTITNIHEPEKISLSGVKTWEGDTAQERPTSVEVAVLANGREVKTITVTPDYEGNWFYEFTDLFKYENGREIRYSIREIVTTGPAASYYPEYEGMNIRNIYHPYGDLKLSKIITQATAVSQNQTFTFIVMLTDDQDVPIEGEYAYTIKNAGGTVLSSGTMGASAEIVLGHGEVFHIAELPEYIHYQISEVSVPGFAAVSVNNPKGIIKPNQTAEVSFTNQYDSEGGINLKVNKTLLNRKLNRYQFVFELYNEDGELIKTASNGNPDETVQREDGTIDYSAASATFGRLSFTEEDHRKTFRYTVKERIAGKAGYTYDETLYTVEVVPVDNGDGTMDVSNVKYYNAEGQEIPAPGDVSPMAFENEYKAEGDLPLRAYKSLVGRDLTEGEFEFELLDEEGNVLGTATNGADGSIEFPALHFTEKDIDKTFYFALREKKGSDNTVHYDDRIFGYEIVVRDNGDGTLSFTQGTATPILGDRNPDKPRYAVRIYGIGMDEDENGETMGITFGPATGESYLENEKSPHIALADETETDKCIHNHSWAEIINQNTENPHVFDACITNHCTKSIELNIPDALKGTATAEQFRSITGDGPAVLQHELKEEARKYYQVSDAALGTNARYSESGIRALLNGTQPETSDLNSLKETLTEANNLFSALPLVLQQAIGKKKVSTGVFDKLWLLQKRANATYPGQAQDSNSQKGWGTDGYGVIYWLREVSNDYNRKQAYGVMATGNEGRHDVNVSQNIGVNFAFALKAQNDLVEEGINIIGWTTEEAPLPVFVNTLEPGSLKITKTTNPVPGAPDQEFTFRLRLIGDELEGKNFDFDFTRTITHPETVTLRIKHLVRSLNGSGIEEIEENLEVPYGKTVVLNNQSMSYYTDVLERENTTLVNLGYKGGYTQYNFPRYHILFTPELPDGYTPIFDVSDYPSDINQDVIDETAIDPYVIIPGANLLEDKELTLFYQKKSDSLPTAGPGPIPYPMASSPMWYAFESGASLLTEGNVSPDDECELYLQICYGSDQIPADGLQYKFYRAADFDGEKFSIDYAFMNYFPLGLIQFIRNNPPMEINFRELFADYTNPDSLLNHLRYDAGSPLRSGTTDHSGYLHVDGLTPGIYLAVFDDPIFDPDTGSSIPVAPYWVPVYSRFSAAGAWIRDTTEISYEDSLFASVAHDIPGGDGSVEPFEGSATLLPDGTYEIKLKANESASIADIPAGTAYQVWEETPEGWVLIESSNISGLIQPLVESQAGFKNEYQPGTASAQFTGLKTLDNSAAEADSFRFELWQADSSFAKQTLLETRPVLAGGFIQFAALLYDQPGSFYYVVREVDPEREDIDYDTHEEHIQVQVMDNGDGTMSAQVTYLPDGTNGISFKNKTRPGSLEIQKRVDYDTEANKDDLFTFKISFRNEKGLPLSSDELIYWYVRDRYGDIVNRGSSETQNEEGAQQNRNTRQMPRNLKAPLRSLPGGPLRNPGGNPIAVFDSADGSLKFYNAATAATFTPTATQTVYDDWERWSNYDSSYGSVTEYTRNCIPWYSVQEQIKSVSVVDEGIQPASTAGWFNGCNGIRTVDVLKLDTSHVTTMALMFRGLVLVEEINLSTWDTSSVTSMYGMFHSCKNLTELDLSSFNTSSVTAMNEMFENCRSITELDLTSFNTENVSNMNRMFADCAELRALDLSSFTTTDNLNYGQNNSQSIIAIFDKCRSLSYLKLGDNTRFQSGFTYLPEPSDMYSSGKWVLIEDATQEPISSAELFNSDRPTATGTWVWQLFTVAVFDSSDGSLKFYNPNISRQYLEAARIAGNDEQRWMQLSETQIIYINFDGNNTKSRMGSQPWASDSEGGKNVSDFIRRVEVVDEGIAPYGVQMMFTKLPYASVLNLEKLDLRNTVWSGNMFGYTIVYLCGASKIILGENFRFLNENTDCLTGPKSPPNPLIMPGDYYTGKWIKEDGTEGPYAPKELAQKFNQNPSLMAGAWIWEPKSEVSVVLFDPQGGILTGNQRIEQEGDSPILLPEPTRFHYIFTGWSESPEGSGTRYPAGSSYTPELGTTRTLYAQWEYDDRPYVTVQHYQQRMNLSGYNLVETEWLPGQAGESITPEPKDYEFYRKPPAQTATVPNDDSLVISYYYDRARGFVHFDGNGADSGQMRDQEILAGLRAPLNLNVFSRTGAIFTGWNTAPDGSGTSYVNGESLLMDWEDNQTRTLYAQWLSNENGSSPTEGYIVVQCKAWETIVIPDLPDGTTYTIEEINNPAGWQTGSITAGDPISAAKVSYVTVNNEYHANGLIYLEAHKLYPNQELEAGAFSFELLDALGNVVATASNETVDDRRTIFDDDGNEISNPWYGTGLVTFGPLEYDESHIGQVFVYSIKEVKGEDSLITYDNHEEKVYVYVRDAGNGTLNVTAEYDEDGPLFVNSRETLGELSLSKSIENATEEAAETLFRFRVDLKDANGEPLEGAFPVKILQEDYEVKPTGLAATRYSHMDNVDDAGNKLSDYNNSEAFNQVVTIEGALRLYVTITWGGESASYDWACLWEGAHPEYTAYNNHSSSLSGKLGGGRYTDEANTKQFVVEGDTVTFAFRSDSSMTGDGYGYYAVIESRIEMEETGVRTAVVSHEGYIELKGGEKAVVTNLPEGASYEITEIEAPGWTLTEKSGDTGIIEIGNPKEALFSNRYDASGELVLTAQKRLVGEVLKDDEFYFELQDEAGNVLAAAPAKADGSITFPLISYTMEDNGKTYKYYIREIPGTREKMIYDTHVEEVVVTLRDGGEGVLIPELTFLRPEGAVFVNRLEYELPSVGGHGPYLSTIFGTMFLALAAAWAWENRKSRAFK